MKKLLTLTLIATLISTSATQAMSVAARRIASTARRTLPIFVRQCSTHGPHEATATTPSLVTSAAALAAIAATGGTVFACGCFGFDLLEEEERISKSHRLFHLIDTMAVSPNGSQQYKKAVADILALIHVGHANHEHVRHAKSLGLDALSGVIHKNIRNHDRDC